MLDRRFIRASILPALAMFLLTSMATFHNGFRIDRGLEPSGVMQLLYSFGMALLAVLWVRYDYSRSRYWPCFEYDALMFFGWPILLPHYLVRTRGLGGLAIIGGLFALVFLSMVFSGVSLAVVGLITGMT